MYVCMCVCMYCYVMFYTLFHGLSESILKRSVSMLTLDTLVWPAVFFLSPSSSLSPPSFLGLTVMLDSVRLRAPRRPAKLAAFFLLPSPSLTVFFCPAGGGEVLVCPPPFFGGVGFPPPPPPPPLVGSIDTHGSIVKAF